MGVSMIRVMRGWQDCQVWKIAIGCAAKCGTTSLARMAFESRARRIIPIGWSGMRQQRIDFSLIPKGYYKIGVVRHPLDRFYSLVMNIRERTRGKNNFYKQCEGLDVAGIWEIISKDLDYDYHFQPQYRVGIDKADVLVKLDHLNEWWDSNKPKGARDMPIENSSSGKGVEPQKEVMASVLKAYETDLKLWERAE